MHPVEENYFTFLENGLISLEFAGRVLRLLVEDQHNANEECQEEVEKANHHREHMHKLLPHMVGSKETVIIWVISKVVGDREDEHCVLEGDGKRDQVKSDDLGLACNLAQHAPLELGD